MSQHDDHPKSREEFDKKSGYSKDADVQTLARRSQQFVMSRRCWTDNESFVLLDYGCVDGVNALALFDAAKLADKQVQLLGVDVSKKPIEEFQEKVDERKLGDSIKLYRIEKSDEMPIDDGTVDIIVACFVLHHVESENQLPVLKAFAKLLKPNGTLILGEFGTAKPAGFDLDDDSLEQKLRDSGFEVTSSEESTYDFSHRLKEKEEKEKKEQQEKEKATDEKTSGHSHSHSHSHSHGHSHSHAHGQGVGADKDFDWSRMPIVYRECHLKK